MAIDHDQIFKTLLKSFFQEFMELLLPDEAAAINFAELTFLEQEIFTDLARGRRKQLDLLVKAGLKGGGEEYVLVHTEFQARKDPEFPLRMFEYYCQLFLRYKKPIVPVAVFTDDVVWKKPIPDTYEIRLRDRAYVSYRYHLIKLKHLDYRQFLASNNPLAFALMAKMRYTRGERVRLKADFLRLILGAKVNPARRSILLDFVESYMQLASREARAFGELVAREPDYRRVQRMITTYEKRGLERGLEKGITRGLRKGHVEGKQETLLLLLGKKFGALDPAVERKVRRIRSAHRLESLSLSVLDAEDIGQLGL